MSIRIITGDARKVLSSLPSGGVQCCVTSPPYYGLRCYLDESDPNKHLEMGLEPTPDEYVAGMVAVFREVRRVLRDDGVLFLNIGDSYVSNGRYDAAYEAKAKREGIHSNDAEKYAKHDPRPAARAAGLKPKDLIGIPWMLAFALRADGWWLRSSITWCKGNAMPESVRDRPSQATEMVFLLAKRASYFYDSEAIAEPALGTGGGEIATPDKAARAGITRNGIGTTSLRAKGAATRNARNWWVINTIGFPGSHFATMPPELAERCIKAGSRPGDTILDPFSGAGTTALVADRLGRDAIGIELNPAYADMSHDRVTRDAGLFAQVSA